MAITETELRALIASISGVKPDAITESARFTNELRMDSLASLDLLVALEEDHEVVISQAEARTIQTFGQLLVHLGIKPSG